MVEQTSRHGQAVEGGADKFCGSQFPIDGRWWHDKEIPRRRGALRVQA